MLVEKMFRQRVIPRVPIFWMSFDVVILDSGSLRDLNATLVGSLKDFVQKRGGGLLLFGNPQPALELLGGLMPATETQSSLAKENLSLFVLPDPLFTERKGLINGSLSPAGMPAELITHSKPAAREVVGLKGAGGTGRSLSWHCSLMVRGSLPIGVRPMIGKDRWSMKNIRGNFLSFGQGLSSGWAQALWSGSKSMTKRMTVLREKKIGWWLMLLARILIHRLMPV